MFTHKCCAKLILLFLVITGGCHRRQPDSHIATAPAAPFRQPTIALCEDYPEESRSLDRVRQDFAVMRHSGVRMLRIAFGWDAMEPQPGRYDWSFWDEFVQLANEHQIRLIPYVCYTPKWNTGSEQHHWRKPPRDLEAFGNFLRAIVTRYKGSIRSWEIWNEPDNQEYWEGTIDEFAELVHTGATAIREADPSAKVVLGGIAWEVDFISQLFRDFEISTSVDVINVHSYFETWSGDPIEKLPDLVEQVKQIVDRYGSGQEIWLAEIGYSNYRQGKYVSRAYEARHSFEHTADYQAQQLFKSLTLLLATQRVPLIAWYRINDLDATQDIIGDVNNRSLGVVGTDGGPKPALKALVQFNTIFNQPARLLNNRTFITRKGDSISHVHVFQKQDGEMIIVAWLQTNIPPAQTPRHEVVDVQLPSSFDRAVTTDAIGHTMNRKATAENVTGRVQLTLQPGDFLIVRCLAENLMPTR